MKITPEPDLILGVAKDLTWADLRPYAVSLACSGFEGKAVMFVENIPDDARQGLLQRGFTLIDFTSPYADKDCHSEVDAAAWTDFGRWRYILAKDYLEKNKDRFKNVIWTDARDLMFQLNPSDWLEDNLRAPFRLVGSGEGWRIKNQPHNAQWALCTSPTDFEWLGEEEVLCAGCYAGDAEMMLEVFRGMCIVSAAIEDRRAGDQGIFNYIMRKSPYKEVLRVPRMSEGFVATGWANKRYDPYAYSTDEGAMFNSSDYVVYTPNGSEPFSIVHQYDRDKNWKYCIEKIMEAAEVHLKN